MSSLSHLVIALSYGLIAAAVAFGLPETAPGISLATSMVIGGILFVGAALLHEIYARHIDTEALAEQLYEVRHHYANALDELGALQNKMAALNEDKRRDGDDDVVAELRMLKSLLGKLAERSVRSAPAAPAALPAPALAVAPAEVRRVEVGAADGAAALSDAQILEITRGALEHNRVELYLQPVVSLPQRKLRHYEAYSRLRGDNGVLIVPEQYIPVAEHFGLVSTIDNMLLFRCVQRIRRRRDNADLGVFCNISPHTLGDQEFFAQFIDFMERNAALSRHLIFEFSQAAMSRCGGEALANLERLATLGFRFSIDQIDTLDLDFTDLRRRNFHFIKVDARTLLSDYARTRAAIDAFDLAEVMRRSGLNLVCEKVETERTVAELLDFNVDFGQGYLFGEPRLARDEAA
ncbi:MAG: EAL domain-containing protein [Alphaproteobacteria bacterium]